MQDPPGESCSDPDAGSISSDVKLSKAVEIAIAEFNALRAELASATTIQVSIISVAFTAIGVVTGYSFNKDGDARLLIVVPLISAATMLVYAGAAVRIASVGSYIQCKLWPYLIEKIGDETLPSREGYLHEYRSTNRWAFPVDGIIGISIGVFLIGSGLASVSYAPGVPLALKLTAAGFLLAATLISSGVLLLSQRGRYF